jgi:hypothetical protein
LLSEVAKVQPFRGWTVIFSALLGYDEAAQASVGGNEGWAWKCHVAEEELPRVAKDTPGYLVSGLKE